MMTISVKTLDMFYEDEDIRKVCVFCDALTSLPYCSNCEEYKGIMTITEWEAYTGEVWED